MSTLMTTYLNRRLSLAPRAMTNEVAMFGSGLEMEHYRQQVEKEEIDVIADMGGKQAERGKPVGPIVPPPD